MLPCYIFGVRFVIQFRKFWGEGGGGEENQFRVKNGVQAKFKCYKMDLYLFYKVNYSYKVDI